MSSISLLSLYREAVAAVNGETCVRAALQEGLAVDFTGPTTLFAVGKAALAMARGAAAVLPIKGGVVVCPETTPANPPLPDNVEVVFGNHPLPDARSVAAGQRLLQGVQALRPAEPALFLISGGASSLAIGLAPGIALDDKRKTARLLMSAGARIEELNAVRKHLSSIKGGQLGAACEGSPRVALVLGDVVGGDLSSIASGLTVADPGTFEDCLAVVHRLKVSLPEAVIARLARGAAGKLAETPKPGDPRLRDLKTLLIASPETLRQETSEACRRAGVAPIEAPLFAGDINRVLETLIERARALEVGQALVGVGEVTVASGRASASLGGRALHLSMLLARALRGTDLRWLVAGSDGQDAMSPYAGAEADGTSWSCIAPGEGDARLAAFESVRLAEAIGRPIPAFASGTNLTDLVIIARG